ncbi:hypothetical protein SynTAK9802_01990 [Synechococcus sp. TAK9802]|nr:hypothetical protein SynTAK9802_01990 [Synechococcus sp. TAK9802]
MNICSLVEINWWSKKRSQVFFSIYRQHLTERWLSLGPRMIFILCRQLSTMFLT